MAQERQPCSPYSPAASPMLPFPSLAPAPHVSCGPTLSPGHMPQPRSSPGAQGLFSVWHEVWVPWQLLQTFLIVPRPAASAWAPVLTPVPSTSSALDFQTESKMGSHQIRCVFSQGNFPFIVSLLREALSFLCLGFFLGIWG